jgi:CRISPR system Cascade subunit CasE
MYLTKIEVDHIDAAQNGLRGYGWHTGLWSSFSPDLRQRPFLYRVDRVRGGSKIYMLSELPPDPLPWGNWNTKPIQPSFLQHRSYFFQLRANPVRRHENTAKALIDSIEVEKWFSERLSKTGLKVIASEYSPPRAERLAKKNGKTQEITFNRVDATGVVEIVDRDLFVSKWPKGIGRGRAFGFGLMLLKPLS